MTLTNALMHQTQERLDLTLWRRLVIVLHLFVFQVCSECTELVQVLSCQMKTSDS
jgi:hypothetical protein